jgi:predicted regulator of Ras-like GTPase activity (Roadblock/LC7/MglB family)
MWPEPIREELAALNGSAHVALPTSQVTAGLARGRVTFTWGQICGWLQPALPQPSAHDAGMELTLPLKVVAPVFLISSKKAKAPALTGFETDIPSLFNDRRSTTPAEEPIAPVVVATPDAEPAAEPPPPAAAEPVAEQAPKTVGKLFGEPAKTEWTPAELVTALAKRPGVSGAVVALQEGLLVAHSLPADVKSETIAAFLPQIFARLNQYSGEMKLGEVDDLLFTTHGAHCQIYRLGFVYFAVLGKPGETLPWPELRLVADELARQTQPKF